MYIHFCLTSWCPFLLLSVFPLLSTRTWHLIQPLITLLSDRVSTPAGHEGEGDPVHLDLTFCCLVAAAFCFSFSAGSAHGLIFTYLAAVMYRFHSFEIMMKIMMGVIERGKKNKTKEKKNTREWLTRSQSTFRKNGWPMMSAKPVWGWQPRRSLGSCGSEGERRVREGRRWWWKRRKVRRRGKEMWRRREFARNV